jgi:hypothetical protein
MSIFIFIIFKNLEIKIFYKNKKEEITGAWENTFRLMVEYMICQVHTHSLRCLLPVRVPVSSSTAKKNGVTRTSLETTTCREYSDA